MRSLEGGAVIEGQQVTLEHVTQTEQSGASDLVTFLGGARRVLILQQPLIYGSAVEV